MRILHFYKTSFPDTDGGVAQVIHQIARTTSRMGVSVAVLSLSHNSPARSFTVDGYNVHLMKCDFQIASSGFSFSAFRRFSQLAKAADVVHYHFPWPFMDVVHFATAARKPCIVTYHSDIVRQKRLLALYRPLQWLFLNSVDRIVATSPNYVASSDVLKSHLDKIRVIPIGLDKASYPDPSSERLAHWRQQIGEKFFLFVGVIRYYKGLDVLLQAARNTDIKIVIAGEGPFAPQLKAEAEALGLRNVQFLGRVSDDDKVALLKLCHGMVFPSHLRSEAFGVSLLEAAMYQKPLICCEIGTGTTFINIAGETGLVVQPGDLAALRQAMQRLWNDPIEAAVMGSRAEARYRSHFEAEQMGRDYVTLYHEVAGR